MQAIKTEIDGSIYYFMYNAEAMFRIEELIDGDAFERIGMPGREGFEATLTAAVQLAEQGELARRRQGYDRGFLPTVEDLRLQVRADNLAMLKSDVLDAICLGLRREVESPDKVVDLGLAELQKKNP